MLKIFLIYSHSLPVSASLFLQSLCLQKCAISLVAMAVHGFFYKQTQLPMGLKLKKMAKSTAQALIVRHRLKLMGQRATLLVDEY